MQRAPRAFGLIITAMLLLTSCDLSNPAGAVGTAQAAITSASSLAVALQSQQSAIESAASLAASFASANSSAIESAASAAASFASANSAAIESAASVAASVASANSAAIESAASAAQASASLTSVASTTTAFSSPPPATTTSSATTSAATSKPAVSASSGGGGTGLCVNSKYFPIKINNQWVYQTTDAVTGAPTQVTQTITAVTPTSFGMQTTLQGKSPVALNWTCAAGGLSSTTLDLGGGGSSPASKMTMTVTNETGVWIPPDADWAVGKKWTVSYDVAMALPTVTATGNSTSTATTLSMGGKGTVTIDFSIVSQEPVTVPAGTFNNAFKVHQVITENLTMGAAGISIPINITFTTDTWYVAGVGQVKSETTIPNAASIDQQLVSYTVS